MTPASQPSDLDEALASRGYRAASETVVMTRSLDDPTDAPTDAPVGEFAASEVDVSRGRLTEDWLAASIEASAIAPDARADYRAILDHLLATDARVLFGRAEHEGHIAAVAIGSLVGDSVSLLQVATRAAARRRGFARSLLRAILYAAREQDASEALLSVEAANAPARALYAGLGFRERYRYSYRIGPGVDGAAG